jgi:hypothetical protein
LKAVTATVGEFARTKWVIDRLITLTMRLAYLAPGSAGTSADRARIASRGSTI